MSLTRIHLFSSKAVEQDLSENRLTEADRATYLVLGWVLYIVLGYSTLIYSNSSRTLIGFVEFASVLAVSLWGLRYAYRNNGGKDGRDFVVRMTCLLLPASIKAYVFVWGAYYVLAWAFRASIPSLSFPTKESADQFLETSRYLPVAMTYLATIATPLVIFVIAGRHLRRIREALPSALEKNSSPWP